MKKEAKIARAYMTTEEAADFLRVTVGTIEQWLLKGKLPQPARIGRKRLFSTAKLIRHLEKRT